jgi:ATP-dependent Clp protease adaptor protein ClpS
MSNIEDIEKVRDEVIESKKEPLKKPSKYGVYLLNNDYIAFHVVVIALMDQFGISSDACLNIAAAVHKEGRGLVATFSKDISDTKSASANNKIKEISAHQDLNYQDCITDIFITEKLED